MERFVDGLRIETEGQGPTALFVHADFVDGEMWREVMKRMASSYRVACYDKRGYGASEKATGPICRRRELEAVIRSLGPGPVHLVGCSNGGQSSLDLALEHPELVSSLTLVNSPPSGFILQGAPPPELLEMIAAMTRGDLEATEDLQIRIWFDGPERNPADFSSEKLAARGKAARMNRIFVENGTFGIADAVPADPLDPPAVSRLSEVRAPTLVVSGAVDAPEVRRAAKLLAEGIPGAALRIMEGCAHVPPMEEPDAFAGILEDFLETVEG